MPPLTTLLFSSKIKPIKKPTTHGGQYMKPYQIISDSSCDLPMSLLEILNIGIVPYFVSFDTVTYYKEILELTPETFYDEVKARKVYPKTSLPPIQDYINVFEPYLKEGKDILCICLTSKFSGSYQSAMNAGNILLETYPDARIEVMDLSLIHI